VTVDGAARGCRLPCNVKEDGAGGYGIATALNGEGTPNPRTGRPWFFGTVRAILESAARRGA